MNTPTTPQQEEPQAPAPQPKKDGNDVKWYDRRLMIPSLIIAPLLFVLFYSLAMRHKPPEGYVFPREPVISGKYKCCEAGGRYSASWVGATQVSCRGFGYYEFLGTNRNDCGLKEQLNGHIVEVTRAYIPSFGDRSPIGVRITAYGQTYYDVSDQRIRELWISESLWGAQHVALSITIILHIVHGIFLMYFHKPTRLKGDQ